MSVPSVVCVGRPTGELFDFPSFLPGTTPLPFLIDRELMKYMIHGIFSILINLFIMPTI